MRAYEFDYFTRRLYPSQRFDRRVFARFIWTAALIFVLVISGVAIVLTA